MSPLIDKYRIESKPSGAVPETDVAERLSRGTCRRPIRRDSDRKGAAAVEFAIVLPVLALVLLGAVDFGRFSYTAIAVTNAARSAAEYGAMNQFDSSTLAAWQNGVTQAAIDEFSQQGSFNSNNLAIVITTATDPNGLRRVRVQATYPFQTFTTWSWIPHSFNIRQTVELRGLR